MTNWFKIARADRDLILKKCGGRAAGAMAVWVAFCDLANRETSQTVTVRRADLARLSGMTKRNVGRVLPLLRKAGLLKWQHNKEDHELLASTYTLPTFTPGDIKSPPRDLKSSGVRTLRPQGWGHKVPVIDKTPDKTIQRTTVKRGF